MSITGIINIGRTLLTASQAQLGVTSHNIANANSPGYSRQEVILEVSTPLNMAQGFVGRGVTVAGIKRHYDSLLANQIVGYQQDYGKSSTLSQTLTGIEQLFNEAQNLGLSKPLTEYFNAWQGVASNPEGLTERNLLLQKSEALVLSAQRIEQGITDILKHTEEGIADITGQINSLASKIARLNDQIIQFEAGSTGNGANDLKDQRDVLFKELGNLVELSSWEDKTDGSLTVTVGMRTLISGSKANTLSAVYNLEGNYSLQLDGQDITSRITKGEMGGLLSARQEITGTALYDLRKLMATLTYAVNFHHAQGFGLDGSTGSHFFNPNELTVRNYAAEAVLTASIPAATDPSNLNLEEYTVSFNGLSYEIYNSNTGILKTSGVYDPDGTTINVGGIQLEISGAVTEQDSFKVSPLSTAVSHLGTAVTSAPTIAASGTLAGLPGDNTKALTLAGLLDSQLTSNSGSLADFYRGLISRIATDSRAASDELEFTDNFLNELNTRRDSISGVNLDDEAANLLRFQRAYQAGAQLIKTADEIYQTILNILNN
ncbi:MAG: flagellar hook-associated protein FlgK [Deltaproteobacteria bacterium]|nr:flagellar hook-associated protein FlgK [Deltaproteobacteria bacterium]